MEIFERQITRLNDLLWGPGTLSFLLGTGLFLAIRLRFLPWRNLGFALRSALGREGRQAGRQGDVSPFAALMTTLAATIGTGNIVGVATALTLGGPGALVWMELSALVGMSTKYAECLLAVKFRRVNEQGQMSGGPMYVMRDGLGGFGALLGVLFALFALTASLGIGSMTQANSIAASLTPHISPRLCGLVTALLAFCIISGGVERIAAVSAAVVPIMAIAYLLAGGAVILLRLDQLPRSLWEMLLCAFSPRAAFGGAAGTILTSAQNAARWGVARGVFSNEAGLGSAAISAAAAATDSPARQGYINMTGVFLDTMVVCTITGLVLCCSGVLGTVNESGTPIDGAALTVLAFSSVLGPWGARVVCIAIVWFAFSTILGWEYQGEKAFEFLFGSQHLRLFRLHFAVSAFFGAVQPTDLVFRLADICNALMCLPNLLSLLLLSGIVAKETRNFQISVRKKL